MTQNFSLCLEPGLTVADTKLTARGALPVPLGWADTQPIDFAMRDWAKAQGIDDPEHVVEFHSTKGGPENLYRHLVPVASITSFRLSPVALQHEVWDNSRGAGPGHYSADLSLEIKDSTSVDWETSASATVGFEVGVEVGFGGNKAEASTNYSFTASVGKKTSHSRETSVGAKSGVDYEVDAGQIVLAVLTLQRGTIQAECKFGSVYVGTVGWGWHYTNPDVNTQDGEKQLQRNLAGQQGIVHGSELEQWLPRPSQTMTLTCDFAADAQIVTRSMPDDRPETIDQTINEVLAGMAHTT